MSDVPVIRVELESMKQSIMAAMLNSIEDIEKMIQRSVDEQVTEEWLQKTIDAQVRDLIPRVIKDRLEFTFQYGDGYGMIKETIDKSIKEMIGTKGS